jgi:hypothetical protein
MVRDWLTVLAVPRGSVILTALPRTPVAPVASMTLRQTVVRYTPYWRANSTVETPLAYAVRIASTSSGVSGVGVHLPGSTDAPINGSSASAPSSVSPGIPRSRA